ncbi:multimerin-2-like [Saccostrea cucullata]|uniref:multimerin-2-like n=1 Tax=Saccostrea cuccullata TaxID=36930 RepID=UPI002ED08925
MACSIFRLGSWLVSFLYLFGFFGKNLAEDATTLRHEVQTLRKTVGRLEKLIGDYDNRFKQLESINLALQVTVSNQKKEMEKMEEMIQDLQRHIHGQDVKLRAISNTLSTSLDIAKLDGSDGEELGIKRDVGIEKPDETKTRALMKRLLTGSLTVPVAFQAYMSAGQQTPHGHETIIFETVQLNVGNGYHRASGIFVAPESGLYVFAWSIRLYGNSYHSAQLVVDNQEYDAVYLSVRDGDNENVSGTAVAQLEKGVDVFVRTHQAYNLGNIESDPVGRTSFCGWKIN